MPPNDAAYLKIVLDPIRVCAYYKPRFGRESESGGPTLPEFQELYQGDPLYKSV
ncbi:MAG: hypothetical protein KGM47_08410 [Acidobacteriota bacterium]|nr:hypothetical protein [Acidobacteriota bacterium]